MPITLPIATLIASGVGAATSAIGSHNAQNANQAALDTTTQLNKQALDAAQAQQQWENQFQQNQFSYQQQQDALNRQMALERQNYQRGQYNQYVNRLSPYATAPQQSLPILNRLLQPGQITASGGNGPTVTMRAPDGSIAQVPQDHVDHYTSLGATQVGANG